MYHVLTVAHHFGHGIVLLTHYELLDNGSVVEFGHTLADQGQWRFWIHGDGYWGECQIIAIFRSKE
jgi:hypothetical protein